MNTETMTDTEPKKGMNPGLISLFSLIGSLLLVAVMLALNTDPYSKQDSHYYRMILAAWSIVLLVVYWFLYKKQQAEGPLFSLSPQSIPALLSMKWLALFIFSASCIAGAFNYYQCDKSYFFKMKDNNDASYYYLNSKYFDELDYFNLYTAVLTADEEQGRRLTSVNMYRDLDSYLMVGRQYDLTDKKRRKVKAAFTPERWESFKYDVEYLVKNNRQDIWQYFFIDHGYNPPPTWTVVGGFLSSITPVENLKVITLIDFLLVLIMFIVIARSFGADTMLFGLLFFLCTFSGRWPVLGESILRFDWVVSLVLAVCMLKKERFVFAGALLAYSALNRIFPAIFFFPYLLYMIYGIYTERKLELKHKQFISGAAAMTVLLVGLGLILYGPGAFKTSAKNLVLHQSSSYSSHRVGLGDAAVYEGERSGAQYMQNGGVDGKQNKIKDLKWILYIAGVFTMVLIIIWVWRKQKPPHELIYLAMIPLFCVTTPQINYFNMRQLLILYHLSDPLKTRNMVGMFLLFVIEAVTQYAMVERFARYSVTSITSIGLTIYFIIMLAIMLWDVIGLDKEEGLFKRLSSPGVVLSGIYTTLCTAVYGVVLTFYWSYGDAKTEQLKQRQEQLRNERRKAPSPNKSNNDASVLNQLKSGLPDGTRMGMVVPYDQLQNIKKSGDNWRYNASVIKNGLNVMVAWEGGVTHAEKIDISFDNNDIYELRYEKGAEITGQQKLRRPPGGVRRGLQQLLIDVPKSAIEKGYDKVIIIPSGGDKRYSIGHFVLINPTFTPLETKDDNTPVSEQEEEQKKKSKENKS